MSPRLLLFRKMSFEGILKDFDNLRKNPKIRGTQLWSNLHQYNSSQREILKLYINYRLVDQTKWLVYATWALAFGTILVLIFR